MKIVKDNTNIFMRIMYSLASPILIVMAQERCRRYLKARIPKIFNAWEADFRKNNAIDDEVVRFAFSEFRELLGVNPLKLFVTDKFLVLCPGYGGSCILSDLFSFLPDIVWQKFKGKLDMKDLVNIETVGDYLVLINRIMPNEAKCGVMKAGNK